MEHINYLPKKGLEVATLKVFKVPIQNFFYEILRNILAELLKEIVMS